MTTTIVGKVAYSDNEHDETMDMVHSEYISNQLPFSTIQSNMPNVVKTTNCPVVLMIAPATVICQQNDKFFGKMLEKLSINDNNEN
ncbi:Hypothetical protein SRAE_X000042100 [Strongyloides ratti]|uniref:Uncharacterized protein n=1 Tax=Strongyloides ratti TaxID=34506 RepID=A0A090LTX1_STRRB|nr:Hypothetical protein SRAE_X000042100 [Strongyloides ratti]CEF71094.1 Hypothetical protein SRAE_X000042100 [Strongyloides ratti]